jgi:hypothetical protein
MGILARSRGGKSSAGSGEGGFVKEFVDRVYAPNAKTIADRGIKIITNAGGLHPVAAKRAIEEAAKAANINPLPVVAAVFGDDLLDSDTGKPTTTLVKALSSSSIIPFAHLDNSGKEDVEQWPSKDKKILSVNAYMVCPLPFRCFLHVDHFMIVRESHQSLKLSPRRRRLSLLDVLSILP